MSAWRASLKGLRADVRSTRDLLRVAWWRVLLFSLVTTFVVCRLSPSGLLSISEFSVLDAWVRARPPQKPTPLIALIGIEQRDVDAWAKQRKATCACTLVSRSDIASAVEKAVHAGARVVALDLSFTQACPFGDHDRRLRAALQSSGDIILVAEARATPDELHFSPPSKTVLGNPQPIIASPVFYSPHGITRSVPLIQTGVPTEDETKRVGRLKLVGPKSAPLCASAAAAFGGVPCDMPKPLRDDLVECAGQRVPVWPGERIYLLCPLMPGGSNPSSYYAMLINWVGPTGTFPMYRFSEVLRASPDQLRDWFGGKIVLLGSAEDRQHTPMVGASLPSPPPLADQRHQHTMSGLEMHANAIDTILRHRYIRPVPWPIVWAIIFVASLITTVVFRAFALSRALVVLALEAAALVLTARYLIERDVWLFLATPGAAIAFSGAVAAISGYTHEREQAAKLAGQLEAVDSITTTLVHDLKQPLASISALAAVLRQQQTKGQVESSPELIQRIEGQVERALGDIDTLLMTDPQRQIRLQIRGFDLAATARDLAVAQSVRSPLHEVEVRAPAGSVTVEGDPRYLGRAINNLVDNAIKYWPSGGTVVVSIESSDSQVVVEVTDRGLGMTAEQQSSIFDRFVRAVPEGLDIPGTGIGLYSVKRIVEAHGGSVAVESQPGEGSTFTIRLPSRQDGAYPAPMAR